MSSNPKDAQRALRRLADSLSEDVFNASEEEMLADAKEIFGDPNKLAKDTLTLFELTLSEQGKVKLAAAKAAVAADRQRPMLVSRLDVSEARRRLRQIITNNPEAARQLTLAARDGKEPSDDDLISMIEDFEELGILQLKSSTK